MPLRLCQNPLSRHHLSICNLLGIKLIVSHSHSTPRPSQGQTGVFYSLIPYVCLLLSRIKVCACERFKGQFSTVLYSLSTIQVSKWQFNYIWFIQSAGRMGVRDARVACIKVLIVQTRSKKLAGTWRLKHKNESGFVITYFTR